MLGWKHRKGSVSQYSSKDVKTKYMSTKQTISIACPIDENIGLKKSNVIASNAKYLKYNDP